jgi:hypothetical protein
MAAGLFSNRDDQVGMDLQTQARALRANNSSLNGSRTRHELSFGEAKEEACNNPNQNFVQLLGSKAKLKGSGGAGGLSVALPSQKLRDYAYAVKIAR